MVTECVISLLLFCVASNPFSFDSSQNTVEISGIKESEMDNIFDLDLVDKEASYKNGMTEFLNDFTNNLRIKGIDQSQLRTKIKAVFVITSDGCLVKPRIVENDSKELKPISEYTSFDYAIIHALLSLNNGKWVPAVKDSKIVSSYFKVMINIHYNMD